LCLVQYLPEFLCFVIVDIQHKYVVFTEAQLNYCTKNMITVCLADKAVYSTRIVTCASSLFFQLTYSHNLCPSKILLKSETPLQHRYESTWIYHLPEVQHITLCCCKNNAWTSSATTLLKNGIILNVSRCLLTIDKFQTLSELLGNTQTSLEATKLHVPDQVTAISNHELHALQEAIPSDVERLEYVRSQISTPHRTIDLNSLLHTSRALNRHEHRTHWYLTAPAIPCTFSVIDILGCILKSYWYKLIPHCQ
jgi:hypothetical protein